MKKRWPFSLGIALSLHSMTTCAAPIPSITTATHLYQNEEIEVVLSSPIVAGIDVSGSTTHVTAADGTSVTITMAGAAGNFSSYYGIKALDGATVMLDKVIIKEKDSSSNMSAGLSASGTGSKITINDNLKIISATGTGGIRAVYEGEIVVGNNAQISGTVSASQDGKVTVGNDLLITSTGEDFIAVHASSGAAIKIGDNAQLNGTIWGSGLATVTATGNGTKITIGENAVIVNDGSNTIYNYHHYGVLAGGVGIGSTVELGSGTTISTKGTFENMGLVVGLSLYDWTGKVLLGDRVTIDTTEGGNRSYGIWLTENSAVTSGDELRVLTDGSSSSGIVSTNNSLATINDKLEVLTLGSFSHGILATSGGKVALGNQATMTTSGANAYAVYAYGSDTEIATGSNSKITTTGDNSYGILASDSGKVILGDQAVVTTGGNSAHGVYSISNSNIFLNSGAAITTTGITANGIYTGTGSSTTLNGATIWVDDSKGSKAIYTESTGNVQGSGLYHITGDIVNSANGTIDLGLLLGSQFSGGSDVGGGTINFDLSDSSHWYMTKDSSVTKLGFASGGAVSFNTAATYGILTVDQLIGDGATFHMRTDIVGDGAGNNQGDLLVVTNHSVGNHFIHVANSGSASTNGTETLTLVDTADGIATFSLTNVVELGGYQYELRRTLTNNSDWELYSSVATPSVGADAGANLFSGSYLLNYAETQTLLKRLGDLRGSTQNNGIWARMHGGKFHSSGDSFLRSYDMNYWGLQTGYDKKFEREDKKGTVYVGGFFGYSKGNLDYLSNGSGSIDSKSIGAYWTHIHRNGFYADAVLKYNWMKSDFKRLDSAGTIVNGSDIDTDGVTGSLEVGRRYFFNTAENGEKIKVEDRQGWYVEPQLQLTVGQQSGGSFSSSNGLRIKAESYRSTMGQARLHLGYEVRTGENPVNIYGKLGVVKEFDGDVDYTLNGSKKSTSYGDTWKLWGMGITAKFGQKHDVHLEVERATGGQFVQSWGINGGYRFSW